MLGDSVSCVRVEQITSHLHRRGPCRLHGLAGTCPGPSRLKEKESGMYGERCVARIEATPIRPGDGNELLLRDTRGPKR